MDDFWAFAWHRLPEGLLVTVEVTVLGILVALAVAFIAGTGRLSDHAIFRWLSVGFIELFRGTSMIVQLFWAFYALPQLTGFNPPAFVVGFVILGLNEGAYAAEVVRSAVVGRAAGQNEAAIALNMGKFLRMRRILIPQSIPAMLPPFGNVMVDLLKNSALVSLVTVSDLLFNAQYLRNTFGRSLLVFGIILVIYYVLAELIGLLTRWLERRFAVSRVSRAFKQQLKMATLGSGVGGPRSGAGV